MDHSPTLLIVWHSRTGTAKTMAHAVRLGACRIARQLNALDSMRIIACHASKAKAEMLWAADGVVLCAPENLGSVSGIMKDFFDRNYYQCLDRLNGKPYALLVAAGSDGTGALRQMQRICTGWRMRPIGEPLIVVTGAQTAEAIQAPKALTAIDKQRCEELGGLFAALLIQ